MKRRSYLNIISNSLEDLNREPADQESELSLNASLNERYNFESKILNLRDEQDSVNFDGIVAVSPPPNGKGT